MPKSFDPSTLGTVILVLAAAAALWTINRGFPELNVGDAVPGAAKPVPPAAGVPADSKQADSKQVQDVTVRDLDGRVVFRGTVDLTSTLERIARGERSHFHDDGSTYHNHEHHLPAQPAGYYTEYVHPTPHLSGPGPQRVVTGRQGEIYYTPDHYRSFVKLQ